MKRADKPLRIVIWLLTIGFLLTALSGCIQDNTGETTAPADGRDKIVDGGKALYTLVYPLNAASAVKAAMDRFVTAVETATGAVIKTKTDEIKRGALYDTSAPEILFGRTGYDETSRALENLDNAQFTVCRIDNKIVIVSPKDTNLDAAVTYFCDNMLTQNLVTEQSGKKTLYMFEDYTSPKSPDGSAKDITIGSRKLSDYVIVYNATQEGYMPAATEMRDSIEAKFGVRLTVYADTRYADTGLPEILVGKTNRSASALLYGENGSLLMTYKIVLQENKMQILCGGPFSARQGAHGLVRNMEQIALDGEYFAADLAQEKEPLAEGADIRIMTANILASRWGEYINNTDNGYTTLPAAERAEIFAAVLANYRPDAVGLQEACEVWVDKLPHYLEILRTDYGLEYTWIHTSHSGMLSMTSVLYRSDKYHLDEFGYQPVSYWADEGRDYFIRSFAWVKLSEKTNPKNEFIVLNTHWELSARLDKVQLCLNEEAALVNSLYSEYGVSVICTGDFNSRQDTDDYTAFMEKAGVADMLRDAEANGGRINKAGGCGNPGSIRGNSGNYIDHIYATSECSGLRFETLVGNMTHYMSDHSAMIADIKFTG